MACLLLSNVCVADFILPEIACRVYFFAFLYLRNLLYLILIKIAYGDDDPTKSTSETTALLTDENVKVIIAPTTVGMLAAGKVLQDRKSDVLLTGLGLPSEMAPFIEDGVCPWMYLWNPIDIGYLGAYTAKALVDGTITGATGDKFTAGSLGDKVITDAADGGTEVMLGDPFKFDPDNIGEWKDVY